MASLKTFALECSLSFFFVVLVVRHIATLIKNLNFALFSFLAIVGPEKNCLFLSIVVGQLNKVISNRLQTVLSWYYKVYRNNVVSDYSTIILSA